jgi:hypothetical protein
LKEKHSWIMGCCSRYEVVQSSSLEDLLINCLGTYWPGQGTMQASDRVVNWPLYNVVVPTYYGPLGKR